MEAFERAFGLATAQDGRPERVAHGIIVAAVDRTGNYSNVPAQLVFHLTIFKESTYTRIRLDQFRSIQMPHQYSLIASS